MTERRIVTCRERFTAVLGDRPPARILLEASTESEWVAQHLEALGCEVVVADPTDAPMYATRSRRVTTDKRDARTPAEALRLGAYRRAHRISAVRRHVRAELAVREALVRTRTRYVSLAKALARCDGLRVASSEAHLAAQRIAALELSPALDAEPAPLFRAPGPINAQIAAADHRLAQLSRDDPTVARLATAPSIGPVTAGAVVATVDDITRSPAARRRERPTSVAGWGAQSSTAQDRDDWMRSGERVQVVGAIRARRNCPEDARVPIARQLQGHVRPLARGAGVMGQA